MSALAVKRRDALWMGAGALAAAAAGARSIPQRPRARVIVDNDFAGDPDGLVALAHQCLAPTTRVELITTSALDAGLSRLAGVPAGTSAALGLKQAQALMAQLPQAARVARLVAGAESFGVGQAQGSAAAQAIVEQALRDDPLPLFITCGGPLTNVAAALRLAPQIAQRLTVVWIGGRLSADGGPEYNRDTDPAAAEAVLASPVPLWQVPYETYQAQQLSIAEFSHVIRPISPLAAWLHDRYAALPPFVQLPGSLVLGDSPMVLLTTLGLDSSRYQTRSVGGRDIRVYDHIDAALLKADFVALLRQHAGTRGAGR